VSANRNVNHDRHPAQWLALAIGIIYVLVGVAGFAVTGFDGFAEPEGDLLFGIFEVNPLHNIVHLLIGGAAWRCGTASTAPASTAGCWPSGTARPSSTGSSSPTPTIRPTSSP
jgi:hypothetical protein